MYGILQWQQHARLTLKLREWGNYLKGGLYMGVFGMEWKGGIIHVGGGDYLRGGLYMGVYGIPS